jgi:hypothetical protein
MSKEPDALKALQQARRDAMARAELAATESNALPEVDLDETECFVRLVIAMYASGVRLGMGVMPDGMAIFIRLSVPTESVDPHSGMVSFVVSDDTAAVLRKAVQALEAPAKPPWWKPDQYARKPGP